MVMNDADIPTTKRVFGSTSRPNKKRKTKDQTIAHSAVTRSDNGTQKSTQAELSSDEKDVISSLEKAIIDILEKREAGKTC